MNKRLIIKDIYPLEELRILASPEDWEIAQSYRSEHRRREWLSWRIALRQSLMEESFMGIGGDFQLAYRDSGAPYIVDTPIYISVSHTASHVAVLICESPCAIDMERLNRRFSSIASRYLSPSEREVVGSTPNGLAIAWCAKESAYKYADTKGLDFIADIIIRKIDTSDSTISLSIDNVNSTAQFFTNEENCVVMIVCQQDGAQQV